MEVQATALLPSRTPRNRWGMRRLARDPTKGLIAPAPRHGILGEYYFPALSGPCESIFNLYKPSRAVM